MAGLILFIANVSTVLILAGLAYFLRWLGIEFAAGALFGIALSFISFRLHYGYWP